MHRRALSSTGYRRGTHYETLGVRREASNDQIKTAFFAMSKEHHPDVPHHKVKPQFHEITEAYNVLRDPVSRRAYDNTLPAPAAQTPSSLHSRHLADTAARFRRASRPPQASSSNTRRRYASPTETPFPRRPPSHHTPLPGALDQHHRHPGQRYKPCPGSRRAGCRLGCAAGSPARAKDARPKAHGKRGSGVWVACYCGLAHDLISSGGCFRLQGVV
ncbi:DnaJ domain-containing protein [Mycena capillaripes]|nr:DnaJ domain-containing protein [Mycena capillaripes]